MQKKRVKHIMLWSPYLTSMNAVFSYLRDVEKIHGFPMPITEVDIQVNWRGYYKVFYYV